jgi:hypothetical protein
LDSLYGVVLNGGIMSSIKLLSELVTWRNFTLKEETPERIIFELWDKANWERIARGINKDGLVNTTIFIILVLGGSILLSLFLFKSWGNIALVLGAVLALSLTIYRIRLYNKNKFTSTPCAVFDRNTDLATGADIDFSTFELVPWQARIKQIDSLSLKWDDPRFDMAMLEALDTNGSLLCRVFGRSNDLRNNADTLKNWLEVALHDEIKN